MLLAKETKDTSLYAPLENVSISDFPAGTKRVIVCDADGRMYVDEPVGSRPVKFQVRGDAGTHQVAALDEQGEMIAHVSLQLKPQIGRAHV